MDVSLYFLGWYWSSPWLNYL